MKLPLCFTLCMIALNLVAEDLSGQSDAANPITRENAKQVDLFIDLKEPAWEIRWRPDGKRFAFLQFQKPVRFFSRSMFTEVTMKTYGKKTTQFVYSKNKDVFGYSDGNQVTVVKPMGEKRVVDAAVQARITFSPDSKYFVTGLMGPELEMRKVADGSVVRKFQMTGIQGAVSLKFSPNGKILAVGNRNDRTELFDVASGKLLRTLERANSHRINFSPDGKRLAVPYADGMIGIWDVDKGELLFEFKSGTDDAFIVCWSPNGQVLATGGLNGLIVLWETQGFKKLHSLPAPERVFFLEFSPDGTLLASAGNSGSSIWALKQ